MGPQFVGGGGIPDFGHAFSNYTYFRPCGRFSLNCVQRPRRLEGEKRKKEKKKERKKEETLVKYKSADMYVGGLTQVLMSALEVLIQLYSAVFIQ